MMIHVIFGVKTAVIPAAIFHFSGKAKKAMCGEPLKAFTEEHYESYHAEGFAAYGSKLSWLHTATLRQ